MHVRIPYENELGMIFETINENSMHHKFASRMPISRQLSKMGAYMRYHTSMALVPRWRC